MQCVSLGGVELDFCFVFSDYFAKSSLNARDNEQKARNTHCCAESHITWQIHAVSGSLEHGLLRPFVQAFSEYHTDRYGLMFGVDATERSALVETTCCRVVLETRRK